jgi:hypothetical protein
LRYWCLNRCIRSLPLIRRRRRGAWSLRVARGFISPGYPLTSFLDNGWVRRAGSLPPFGLSSPTLSAARTAASARTGAGAGALAAAAEASPSAAPATGRLTGRVVDPETRRPVASGQVVASGNGDTSYTTVGSHGTFTLDALPAGDCRLFVHSFTASARGAWVGGASIDQATPFAVGDGTTQVGDVWGIPTKQVTVKLAGEGGQAITDGVAVLVDDAGREAAAGRTDAAGSVTLTAPPATYTLAAASPSTAPATTTVDLRASSDTTMRLDPAAVVTASVRDEHGAPLPASSPRCTRVTRWWPSASPTAGESTPSPAWSPATTPSGCTRRWSASSFPRSSYRPRRRSATRRPDR